MSYQVDLSKYNNKWYQTGGGLLKRVLWHLVNAFIVKSYLVPISSIKVMALRLFGAKIGRSVVIKPGVNIKYPWKLSIGNFCWIGENVWIDNLEKVTLEDHVCLSQGAFLLCGNHDYKKVTFDLRVLPIVIQSGAWIGAKSIVCPGVTVGSHAVLTVGSIALCDLEPNFIYKGNPAVACKERKIS